MNRLRAGAAAAAGALSAGTALATTEAVAAVVDRDRPSLIGSMSSWLIEVLSGSLKDVAIRLFGVHDKAALLTGIVIVGLLAGALLGLLGSRRPLVAVLGLCAFAAVGVAAAHRDPLASTGEAVVASIVGTIAGTVALLVLLRFAADLPPRADSKVDPRTERARAARRRFLVTGGAVGAVAVGATVFSRRLRSGLSPVSSARRGTLPAAARSTPVPAGASFDVDGLTPYVTAASDLYRIDTATFVPRIDLDTWLLRITGMIDHPATYTYDDLAGMALVEEPVTIACVSNNVNGHLIGNGIWRGVPLAPLLARAGVHPAATQIVGRSVDDFTVGIPTSVALDGRVALVALGLDGDVLPDVHGFPARLIVSGLYGYASATKWLTEIELTRTEDVEPFWVQRGWSRDGSIEIETRIDVPGSGATVRSGTVTIAGVAWAPSIGITMVEVQIDRGDWRAAQLAVAASPNTWVQWRYDWSSATPGSHLVAARATDRMGRVQTDQPRVAEPQGATGYPYRGFTIG